jgi:predicted phage replisome organizer
MDDTGSGGSTGKRYYWLKLQDGFFGSKRIKKLRKLAGGDTYTIIYLKMQLLAMKSDGILRWTGLESDFASELALDLDEEPDNVEVTLRFLLAHGLAETSDNISFFLPYAVENTGSEGSSAKRVREFRKRQSLQCNAGASQSNARVTGVKRLSNGEKEIELEKELDIEEEKDSHNSLPGTEGGGLRGEQTQSGKPVENHNIVEKPVDNSQQQKEQDFEKMREAAMAKLREIS